MKSFSERVVEVALSIPKGKVTTYGRIARAAGAGPMASQSITSILAKAAGRGVKVPFHRIVYADGRAWLDKNNRAKRLKLYESESLELDAKDRIKDFRDHLFEFE